MTLHRKKNIKGYILFTAQLTNKKDYCINNNSIISRLNIIEGKYSSIIYKPADDGIIIDTIILFIRKLSSKENIPFNVLFPMECHLFLPTVEDRCTDCKHLINLYFTNASHCSILKERANEYFNEHYDEICKKDKHSAEFIKSAFKYNGV